MSDAKLKAVMDRRVEQVWVVEFVYYVNGQKYWKATEDTVGEYIYFKTRKEATENKDTMFHGHHKDLRVSKYLREDSAKLVQENKHLKSIIKELEEQNALSLPQVTSANAGY